MKMQKMIKAASVCTMLALASCGGSANTANPNASTATNTISLTGVAVSGTIAVGAISTGTSSITGAFPGTVVIAADQLGNTKTASADQSGKFSIALNANTTYVITFYDPKTMKPLGSLIQGTTLTKKAGAVTTSADSDLGNVVINAAAGLAVSENEAKGTLKNASLAPAPAGMDTDGDGKVSRDEVSEMQAATASSSGALSTVSLMTRPNTWLEGTGMSDTDHTLEVFSMRRVQGPGNQGMVNSSLDTGMIYNAASGYSSTAVTTTAAYSLNGSEWSWTSYDDIANNIIWDNNNGNWSSLLPLNFTLGKALSWVYSEDMYSSTEIVATVNLAKENGKSYIFKDISGVNRIVVKADLAFSLTCKDSVLYPGKCTSGSQNASLYLVLGYNTPSMPTVDTTGKAITPSAALAKVTFGTITTDAAGKFVSATNQNPLQTATTKLTDLQRTKLLKHLWDNSDAISAAAGSTGATTASFLMTSDAYGQSIVPAAYDNVTFAPAPLQLNASTIFKSNVSYTSAAASAFTFELRSGAKVLASSTTVTATATATPMAMAISAAIPVPLLATIKKNAASATFSAMDYTTGLPVDIATLDLWLVMKDTAGAVQSEQFVDTYFFK